jgi:hypothetical protein
MILLKKKNSDSNCHLCEENNIEYKCSLCNYILCKECLRRLNNLNCPQCRQEIVLTSNQNSWIRNSENINVGIRLQPHNIIVSNSNESRGVYDININIYQRFSTCLYSLFFIIFTIGCYFVGYYLTDSHKHIIGNFFLGFLLLLTLCFSLAMVYNIISSCLGYNSNYSSSYPY